MKYPHVQARSLLVSVVVAAAAMALAMEVAWAGDAGLPLRQSELEAETAGPPLQLTLRDASRDSRWLGLGVRDVRWAPDGEAVYLRWNTHPRPDDDPDADPWYVVGRDGDTAAEVPLGDVARIPEPDPSWSRDGSRAAWTRDGTVWLFDSRADGDDRIRAIVRGERPCRLATVTRDGAAIHFMLAEDLYRYDIDGGTLRQISRVHRRQPETTTAAGEWLKNQQLELFEVHRSAAARRQAAELRRALVDPPPQAIPVSAGEAVDRISISPDGERLVFRAVEKAADRPPTHFMDFVSETGYAEVREARAKVGEPQDRVRLGIVRIDPAVPADDVGVRWVEVAEAAERAAVIWGPYWSPDGRRSVVVAISDDHKDLWIAELEAAGGTTSVLAHDRDDAWLGGPPIQANYWMPPLLEWLADGSLVFASERSGWSHLYRIDPDGEIHPLTSGEWEVRDATLSRDRSTWLLTTSREHPSDDHLYTMPAAGGRLTRLTAAPGRHHGVLSPDGDRLAVISSDSVHLPDLFLRDTAAGTASTRITISGTDNFYRHPLAEPEIVSFPHSDGRALWAALFKPEQPNPEHAAVLHIHGGGYRQFSHHGWSVYGWDFHLAAINYLVQQGYTVLDFDYRGSAGFGRDYRTDIYRSMGVKDIDGMVTAADYLVTEHGIDRSRIGIYGISYGGFSTLMALFRYPGVFAAGVANASVTDWAHYSHEWTSRILNTPTGDPDAYRVSSPIYHADGLADPLLIVHGLVDDNVHFQDVARLVQRLIELEKDFEVMVYPVERHVIATEASRYDYVKRLTRFLDAHLLRR